MSGRRVIRAAPRGRVHAATILGRPVIRLHGQWLTDDPDADGAPSWRKQPHVPRAETPTRRLPATARGARDVNGSPPRLVGPTVERGEFG